MKNRVGLFYDIICNDFCYEFLSDDPGLYHIAEDRILGKPAVGGSGFQELYPYVQG